VIFLLSTFKTTLSCRLHTALHLQNHALLPSTPPSLLPSPHGSAEVLLSATAICYCSLLLISAAAFALCFYSLLLLHCWSRISDSFSILFERSDLSLIRALETDVNGWLLSLIRRVSRFNRHQIWTCLSFKFWVSLAESLLLSQLVFSPSESLSQTLSRSFSLCVYNTKLRYHSIKIPLWLYLTTTFQNFGVMLCYISMNYLCFKMSPLHTCNFVLIYKNLEPPRTCAPPPST
jgi:hypothetical protein